MPENAILSYLTNTDWSTAFQWYMNHLDIGYLIWLWSEGRVFTQQDWMSIMLISVNLIAAITLAYLFIKRVRNNHLHASTTGHHAVAENSSANSNRENDESEMRTQLA